ncbi:1-deoxy-D-xylulose-5-phosphate synthase [Klebsiella pneumoniae subsp. pneumoniae]|nr:1-deoxy-D-xylulose-5-phosphate synthase [Klebsiella pneumoniae subsp. pneumoniae]
MPPIKELLKRTEEHIKGMVVPGTLFEELGFNYIGPVDGHDVLGLVSTLKNMRDLKGPQFLHIMTKKGRGYEPAGERPDHLPCGAKIRPYQRRTAQKQRRPPFLLENLRRLAV